MKRVAGLAFACFSSLTVASMAQTMPSDATSSIHDRLTKLAEEFTYTSAKFEPMKATALGLQGYDGQLETLNESTRNARIERLKAWTMKLDSITKLAASGMSLADADDAKLLRAQFDAGLNALLLQQADRKNYAGPALEVTHAIYTQFLHLPIPGREGATKGDVDKAWDDIISRLSMGPVSAPTEF